MEKTQEQRIADIELGLQRIERTLDNTVMSLEVIGLLIPDEEFYRARDVLFQLQAAEQQAREYRKGGVLQKCLSGRDTDGRRCLLRTA